MRTTLLWAGLLGAMLAMAASAPAYDVLPGATSAPAIFQSATPGMPPAFRNPRLAPRATQMEVKYFKFRGTNGPDAFAQASYPSDYYSQYTGAGTVDSYLKSPTGPGGYRMFPAGTYRVQWRGRNSYGSGPWSTTMPFQVSHPALITTTITSGPRTVKSGTDLTYRWKNNFAASAYRVQIRRNGRLLGATNGPGVFQNGWINESSSYYSDRPTSPARELPNGAGYEFRVSSYSPVLGKWTTWTNRPFRISRGKPALPQLYFTQQDFGGAFSRSPRPFFGANYGYMRMPALWTYFDIRRKVGSQLQVVRKTWASRYHRCSGNLGGSATGVEGGKVWVGGAYAFPDLKAGKYVYRARAWNGPAANQSRWTAWRTTTVVQAGTLIKPPTNGFGAYNYGTQTHITWRGVPNAYTYNVAVYRNGSFYQTWRNLDPRVNPSFHIYGSPTGGTVSINYTGPPLTTGVYRFAYQAVNNANPPATRTSIWSTPTNFPGLTVP